jgi:hypothetical protein
VLDVHILENPISLQYSRRLLAGSVSNCVIIITGHFEDADSVISPGFLILHQGLEVRLYEMALLVALLNWRNVNVCIIAMSQVLCICNLGEAPGVVAPESAASAAVGPAEERIDVVSTELVVEGEGAWRIRLSE